MATFGIEEEVFIVEPTKPSVQSLYYIGKLVWKNPKKYLLHTDSNFARSKDILQGLMSGVEISTSPHSDSKSLMEDFSQRRQDLCKVSEGLIVALGHLFDYDAPTNTCALQFHVGDLDDFKTAYRNLAYFLPLLILLCANSPAAKSKRFGQSYRLLYSYAVGPLRQDWTYRFQDLIFAKRTKTIELRAFDPVWDLGRVKMLIEAIEAIVKLKSPLDSVTDYNNLRKTVCVEGYIKALDDRFNCLSQLCYIDKNCFTLTPADIIWDFYKRNGLENTYAALDYAYRHNADLSVVPVSRSKKNPVKIAAGIAGYFIPKLPYDIWKYLREH
ncbi:MAG: hypothetical protein C4562_06435 [Actinobacteria bacterium]|nr:MAG: hypothetical protein C4562_06435 [Actinomycetota bacterium]